MRNGLFRLRSRKGRQAGETGVGISTPLRRDDRQLPPVPLVRRGLLALVRFVVPPPLSLGRAGQGDRSKQGRVDRRVRRRVGIGCCACEVGRGLERVEREECGRGRGGGADEGRRSGLEGRRQVRHLEDRTLQTQKPKRPSVSETRVTIKEGECERETDLILCMPDLLAPALSGLLVRLVARSQFARSNKVARPNERLDERLSSNLLGLGVATRLKLTGVGVADERQDGVLGVSDAVKEAKKEKKNTDMASAPRLEHVE